MSGNAIDIKCENGETIHGYFQEPFNLIGNLRNPVLMVFFHGFPQNISGAQDNLIPKLQNVCARQGIFSLRFNFRGSGESDGVQENFTLSSAIEDVHAVKEWIKTKNFNHFMICAEGLGTTVALSAFREKVLAGAFLWPVFQVQDYADRNLDAEKYADLLEKDGYVETKHGRISLQLIKELSEIDIEPLMNKVEYPCLLQQGAKDDIVPMEFLDMASAHFRNRRIEITSYQDGTHGLPQENHTKNLLYHFEQFVQKYS